MKKKVSIITTVLGVALIIMELIVAFKGMYSWNYNDVPDASFGADFYTYTYDALDTIVSELSNLDSGIEALICTLGMIIIAIGVAVFCFGLYGFANASATTPGATMASTSEVNTAEAKEEEENSQQYEDGVSL